MIEIHTVNTTGSVMWDVLRDNYGVTSGQMKGAIHDLWAQVVEALKAKGIDYASLRPGLVPQVKRKQVALFFDTTQIDDGSYGRYVHRALLPLVSSKGTHSVLSGDLLGSVAGEEAVRSALSGSMIIGNAYRYTHSSSLYAVVINNLSAASVERIHDGLMPCRGFIGHVDICCQSLVKLLLAGSLVPSYLMHRGVAIIRHEDGRGNSVDCNETPHPFEESGVLFRSIEGIAYDAMLVYRIERPLHPEESATELELGSVAHNAVGLFDTEVVVKPEKFEYLMRKKKESFDRAGLSNIDSVEMSELVRSQLRANYVFNLRYLSEHDVVLFNVVIEVPQGGGACHRFVVSLEYLETENAVKLVTMF